MRTIIALAVWFLIAIGENTNQSTTATSTTTSPAVGSTNDGRSLETFFVSDLRRIVDASRNQEARFNRDFKNQPFDANVTFYSASEGWFGDWLIHFNTDTRMTRVYCLMAPPANLADWQKGKHMHIYGVIDTTMFGDVNLNECQFSAWS
jgi:hypothetical protein